jgi:hypothetical protein
MQPSHSRVTAALLWLRARYEKFSARKYGRVGFLIFVISMGIFSFVKPALAWPIPSGDDIANLIASVGNLFAGLLAGLIVTVIEYLIPVMLYNDFSNAPVVVYGWALMRDTVNMFFVIVLIVIAFGTIFGSSKFKWQSQVPRLMIFAILINFSKTLAGLMIDFGQVVMLTFANALSEIAAGNIIQLFGLNKISAFSGGASAFQSGGQGVESWGLAFASIAAVFILAWILTILLLMFGILLYRIVALWVAIVLAPLAWFVGGAPILGSSAYSDWWTNFKCLVAIGPIITFFLWLALAVAGAGSTAQGFDTGTVDLGNSASFLTKIFELQSFMSLVVGSAMIMVGMDTAQKFCSASKAKFIGAQLGKAVAAGPAMLGVAKGGVMKGVGWTGRKVGAGTRAVGRFGAREVGGRLESKPVAGLLTQRGRARAWQKVAGAAGTGVLGKTLGVTASRNAQALLGERHAEIAKAGEKYKDDSKATKLSQLERFAQSGAKTVGGKHEAQALFKEALGDEEMQKELVKSGSLNKLWEKYGATMESDFQGDAKTTDQLKKFKMKYASMTGASDLLKDKADIEGLDSSALFDKKVREKMAGMEVKVDVQEEEEVVGKDGKMKKRKKNVERTMSAAEAIAQGHFGEDKRKAWEGQSAPVSDADLRLLSSEGVVGRGSDSAQRAASLAIEEGDMKRVNAIVSVVKEEYEKPLRKGQTLEQKNEERFHAKQTLDAIKDKLQFKLMEEQISKKSTVGTQRMIENIDIQHKEASDTGSVSGEEGKFGRVPPVWREKNPADFVRANFANAETPRIENAEVQLWEQHRNKNIELENAVSQYNNKLSQARAKLDSEGQAALDRLSGEMANIDDQMQALDQDLSATAGKATLEEQRPIRKQIEDLEVKKTQVGKQFQDKLSENAAVNPASIIEVKELGDKMNQLEQETAKIRIAAKEVRKLVSERSKQA